MSERAAKRFRSAGGDSEDACCSDRHDDPALALPNELWARAIEYLPFEAMLSCAATCRTMLSENLPLVKTLRIEKALQMNIAIASRFRDVKHIYIYSLFCEHCDEEDDEFCYATIDLESRIRSVPFLSRFQKLQNVFFGAKNESGEILDNFAATDTYFNDEPFDTYPSEADDDKLTAFIDQLSGAFCCGALHKQVKIFGLCCPNNSSRNSCQTCQRACKNFPLESVIDFESKGSSANHVLSGRPPNFAVCLDKATVESIIENRPKGHALLHSEWRLLKLLGSARRYKIDIVDSERALYVAKYGSCLIREMKRVIKYSDLDVNALTFERISASIMKSFVGDRSVAIPTNQCCIAKSSLDDLRKELGIDIHNSDFEAPFKMPRNLEQIVRALILWDGEDRNDGSDDEDQRSKAYDDIQMECIVLLRQFLETTTLSSIQHIIDMVPSLNFFRGKRSAEFQSEALRSVEIIIANMTEKQRKSVIEAGDLPPFAQLLKSNVDGIVTSALTALHGVMGDVTQEHMEEMVEEEIVSTLIAILDSESSEHAKKSLTVLGFLADYHSDIAIAAGIVPHIFRIIESLDEQLVSSSLVLLLKFLESNNFHGVIQDVLDSAIVPRLLDIIEATEEDSAQRVLISLASLGSIQQTNALVQVPGFLPAVRSLQRSSSRIIAWTASLAIENLVTNVDSDDESDIAFEEAEEASDELIGVELQQAEKAANKSQWKLVMNFDIQMRRESPTLMGLPQHLLKKIVYFAVEKVEEVCALERVCKRICKMTTRSDEFWINLPAARRDFKLPRSRRHVFEVNGLRKIRYFQRSTINLILSVLCRGDDIVTADTARDVAADLISRLIEEGSDVVQFRLRGDAVAYLLDLLQDYMVGKLEDAVLLATHAHRTEVQAADVMLVFKNMFQSFPNSYSFQGSHISMDSTSREFPSSSRAVWRWPANDCTGVLPPEAGRRIIRSLAYRAGVNLMSGDAFVIAETELIRAMGIILANAYESSVQIASSARFLDTNDTIRYETVQFDTITIARIEEECKERDAMDMFNLPPPPFCDPPKDSLTDGVESEDLPQGTIYTIVAGQIAAAAEHQGIKPFNVYGGLSVWTSSEGYSVEEEIEIERSFYYKPYYLDDSDSDDEEESMCSGESSGDNYSDM